MLLWCFFPFTLSLFILKLLKYTTSISSWYYNIVLVCILMLVNPWTQNENFHQNRKKKEKEEMCVGDDLYASVCVPSDPKQHIIIAIASPHNFLSCEYRIFDFWYTYTCMRLRWWLHVGFSLHKLCRCVFKLHVVYMTMTPKTR